ncbi:aspartate aminotransferase family protein [Balneola vulgaris]|uniref:aspartate aminotransferase family protein n=1 Tax=Balneola vulgaris TaxID=287535 RepID=UPI000363A6EC|nr:aspartate aminotransferase family protein [Balneola vulgaris]
MSNAQLLEKENHLQVYNRYPVTMSHGKGAKMWDVDGNEYLDLLAGIAVNNLGHCHPKIVAAIKAQADKMLHLSNFYYTEAQSEFAQKLVQSTGLDRAFLCNSGVEAMEACVKLARKWGNQNGKTGPIISLSNGFHGRSVTTITMSKETYQQGFEPLPSGFEQSPFNDLEALRAKVNDQTLAITFEIIQGNSGVHVVTQSFIDGVVELCEQHNVLLIIDEVQTGVGRTGKFWAYQHFGIKPDIVASAKALASGIPIGAMMAKEEIASALQFGNHGTTFGGNPFACAVGLATFQTMEEENIVDEAHEKGAYMMELIKAQTAALDTVVDVRGLGLMIGVELKGEARPVVEKMFAHKVLCNAAGGNVLRILPPLTISTQEIEKGVDVMVKSIKEAL